MKKPNLVFMHGEDSFSLLQELRRWRHAFLEKQGDLNLNELDGNCSAQDIAEAARQVPFLGEKRLVIVKNFLASHKADTLNELIPHLNHLPDSSILVLAEAGKVDKRSSLYKFLAQHATLKAFIPPKGAQVNHWLRSQAQKHGGSIDPRNAGFLIDLLGEKLWILDNEIQKLCHFADGQPITLEMINKVVQGSAERSIFTLTDQLGARNHKAALKTLRELEQQGHEAPYLFAMMARQFRIMLEAKALAEDRLPESAIASKMKAHPFVVKQALKSSRNFTYHQLEAALKALLKIDQRLKHGHMHLRTREAEQYLLALEKVLLKH